MTDCRFTPIIERIRSQSGQRFDQAAYFFLLEALDFTIFRLGRQNNDLEERHISPPELMDGLRLYATEEFGPMAPFVFRRWGLVSTGDFGTIVFQMCDAGLLRRQERDTAKDFEDCFDFEEAFAPAW